MFSVTHSASMSHEGAYANFRYINVTQLYKTNIFVKLTSSSSSLGSSEYISACSNINNIIISFLHYQIAKHLWCDAQDKNTLSPPLPPL